MRSTFTPRDAAALLRGVRAPWWIAGGWAIDLFLGRETRPHEDLDVAILRRDQRAFRAALPGWDLHVGAGGGALAGAWRAGEDVPPERPAVWCRPSPEAPWAFELLLGEADGDAWRYRKDARVTRPIAQLGMRDAEGIPYLAPEIVLLHKAGRREPRDERDFEAALPALDASRRAWLAAAIPDPAHPWRARL